MSSRDTKQRTPLHDPHAEREAQKYDNPIASRELILELIEELGEPANLNELAEELELIDDPDRLEALRRRLKAMERDGQLVRNRRGGYLPVNQTDLLRGRVIGHQDGFGFLTPDDGSADLYLSPREMTQLLHGDRAVVQVSGFDRKGRREGAVVEILERANSTLVGRLIEDGEICYVRPDHKRIHLDILIPEAQRNAAEDGQIVKVEITAQPTLRHKPQGRVLQVLGDHMAAGMEVEIAVNAHGIPHEWPEPLLHEIAAFGEEVDPAATAGRVDLRRVPLVTIDGADARDFDDAVYCEPSGGGKWRLLVAIADVSHYVQPDSELDREAERRGTSVYFPGEVIPMLPEQLSNGLCSLNPAVDRLCMVCELVIGRDGRIQRYKFFDAVMRSHARLLYDEVAAILVDRDPRLRAHYQPLVPYLENLHELFKVLLKARHARGTIDFETTETKIEFGAQRKIEQIVPVLRNDAHRLIEECMIAANVAAAQFLRRHKIPCLFRLHDGPDSQKLEDLRSFLSEMGLRLPGGKRPKSADYAKLIEQLRDRPDFQLIQTVLLRSLTQAVYSPADKGHFGLSLENYAHFTSPIRRYPDLLVHRAIRHILRGGNAESFIYGGADMIALGDHCSVTERRADEATRDVMDWLKCEYMLDKVGEEFDGIITAVTSFGLFVQLSEIHVEGLIHVTSLASDFYRFEPTGHRLVGERSGQVYRLADPIRIKVVRVDLDERKMDFMPADLDEQEQSRPRSRSRKKRSRG